MLMEKERELIVEYGKKMSRSGLCPGTSGNLSIYNRELGLMAISPSGIDYFETLPEDVVITDLNANIVDGCRKPSSEWALHTNFYKAKPDCGAVVHTHSVHCAALAALHEPLRAVHIIACDAGVPEVPCAPYKTFGTVELAEEAIKHCGDSKAVLLANHGIVCCGKDIDSAFSLAKNMEYCAQIQLLAMAAGTPKALSQEDIDNSINRLKTYGQKKDEN